MKYILLLFIYFQISFAVFAIHPIVRNFTRKEYRSGTQNWAIVQDSNNVMYFANNDGLLMFDGKVWNTFPIRHGTNVRSIAEGANGRIYASTFNEIGYFKKGGSGTIEYFSLTEQHALRSSVSNELFNIHVYRNLVYFQGGNTIFKYDGNKIATIAFQHRMDASALIRNNFYVASQIAGLFILNGNLFIRIDGSELLLGKRTVSILPYEENKVLIVTAFDGTYLFDGSRITPYNTGVDAFLRTNQVFCAATNGEHIVFGTVQKGIVVYNLTNGEVRYHNSSTGLQNNTVLSVAFDQNQNVWLGLDKGIDYVLLNQPIYNILGTNNQYGAGYTSHIMNNRVYFGTNQGLFYSTYPLRHQSQPIVLQPKRGMEVQVWSLKEIDNTLFCGDDRGAYIIHPNRIERIVGLTGVWNFIQLKNRPDLILGCSYQGLFILKKTNNQWRFSHFIKGDFNQSSPMFEEDIDGSIWLSHWQNGLFRLRLNEAYDSIQEVVLYNESKGLPTNTNNTLFKINNELIFSSERGLYSYDRKMDRMVPNEKWNALFNTLPSYMRLHQSPTGDVWCVSGRFIGLARKKDDNSYAMDSLSFRMLQSKLIIGFEHFNFINDRHIIVNTEDGFSLIDVTETVNQPSLFKVKIHHVMVTNDRNLNNIRRINVQAFDSIHSFKSDFNSIRFGYHAPEYRNDGLVEYSYKLENYDQRWSDFSSEAIKEFNHLPRGEYVFKVRARNLLEKQETETEFRFVILPAWYETNVAFFFYFLLLMLMVMTLVVVVNYHSKRGAVKMKEIKEKEMQEQKKLFDEETQAKKKEIKELKNQQLQYELRHKSQELASSTMNLIRKNEILLEIVDTLNKTTLDLQKTKDTSVVISRLSKVERSIRQNIENDNNWKRFEENFDLVYEHYLKRLSKSYPELNMTDKKICAYIKMDLSSKDMAPLLNMSVRSIETNRYRIRKKIGLNRDINLSDFLQKF